MVLFVFVQKYENIGSATSIKAQKPLQDINTMNIPCLEYGGTGKD